MLRTLLVVLPSILVLGIAVFGVMIPVTWILGDVGPMYAMTRHGLRLLFRLAGVRVEVRGFDPWKAPQPCVFLCNHVSNLDPPALFAYLPRVAVIAKAVLFRWPLLGRAMKMGEFIEVVRNKADSRRQAMESGITRLRNGRSLLIFPEGTRSRDGAMLPFRPGPFTMAIETQVPLVPITILGARELLRKGKMGIRPGCLRLVIHPPVPTAGMTVANREPLMKQVRETIASALRGQPGRHC